MLISAERLIPVTRASNVMGRRLDLIKQTSSPLPPFLAVVTAMLGSGGAIGQSLGRRKCSGSEGLKGKVLEGYIYPCSMPTTFGQVESFLFMTIWFLIIQIAHNSVFRSGVMGKCLIIQNGLFDIEQAVKSLLDKDFFLQQEISVHWPAIAFSIQGRADDLRC